MWSASARTGLAVVALAACLATNGCGGGAGQAAGQYVDKLPLPQDTMTVIASEPGEYGGRFVLGQTSSPKTFNAIMATETSTTDVTNLLFTALTDLDYDTHDDFGLLAKSWDISPDGLTYTFHMRRGAAFSDGHPITSEDVLFSFAVAYDDSLHPSIQDLLKFDGKPFGLSAPDSYTVVIVAPKVHPLFTSIVGSLRIMPKHKLDAAFRKGEFASAYGVNTAPNDLVTSGPWRLKEFVADQKTVLERNPYWFGVDARGKRLPYLDELVFLIAKDQNTAALKFHGGELDALDNVKPEDYPAFEQAQAKEGFKLYDVGPALNTNFMWFNLNTVKEAKGGRRVGEPYVDPVLYGWFRNPTFRRAISKAVDRDAMIRGPFYGFAVKNWSISTVANKKWYTPETPFDDYDPEGAKELLDGLGLKDRNGDGVREDAQGHPVSFAIKTNGDNNLRMSMCNLLKDDLAKVGVRLVPTGVDFNTLTTNFRQDFQYEAALLGVQTSVPPDPGMGANIWRSSGLLHYWNIKQKHPETDPERRIDELYAENVSTLDEAKRKRAWAEMQRITNEQCYFVWLPTQVMRLPVRTRFGNVAPNVMPHRILWNIDRVFMRRPGTRA